MTKETLEEILLAIEDINLVIEEILEDDRDDMRLSFNTNIGFSEVKFAGISVWNSENDDRTFFGGEYDFDQFLRNQVRDICDKLSLLNF